MTVTQAALAGLAVILVSGIAFAIYRIRGRKHAASPQASTDERSVPARTPAPSASAASSDLPSRVPAKSQGPRHAPRRDYWNDMRPRRTFDTGRPLKRRAAQRGR